MADIQHKNITGADAAHPPFYASESDPTTTLGAYRGWFKPSTGEAWIRNAANSGWISIAGGGGGGSGGHTIQDEGSNLTARTNLNFTGAGVTVTDDSANDQTDVTIPGGTADPASETVAGIIEIATQTETNTGTDNTRAITPQKLAGRAASETLAGVAEVATQTETNTGTDDARMVTPAKLAGRTSTDTRAGVVELATDAETQTGTDTTRAITPANLSARSATETRSGVIEIATQVETDAGTDDARAVTPAKLANYSGLGGGTSLPSYTVTNEATDRAYDADATSIDELADVLGTLINDLSGGGGGGGGSGYATLVELGSDVTNATTSYADVTALSFAFSANTTYRFRFYIYYTVPSGTNGSRWSVNHSVGGTLDMFSYTSRWPATATTESILNSTTVDDGAASTNTGSTAAVAKIEGFVRHSVGGTLIARFASETGGTVVAKTGSTLEYW